MPIRLYPHDSKVRSPYVPPSADNSPVPNFKNTEKHFEIYLKVRTQMAEGSKYRRDRQTDMVKWVGTLFPAFTAGLFAFAATADHPLPTAAKWGLALSVMLIALLVAFRIVHDAGQMKCDWRYVNEMDKVFGLQIPNGKLGSRFQVSAPSCRSWFDWWERSKDGGIGEVIFTPIVAIYLAFVGLLTLVFLISLCVLP